MKLINYNSAMAFIDNNPFHRNNPFQMNKFHQFPEDMKELNSYPSLQVSHQSMFL